MFRDAAGLSRICGRPADPEILGQRKGSWRNTRPRTNRSSVYFGASRARLPDDLTDPLLRRNSNREFCAR